MHQAAYQTVKLVTRYVQWYPDVESLYVELPDLLIHVGKAVKYGFLHPENAGTASCVVTRTFVNADHIQLVAGGIGDGLVAVFDPVQGFFKTLIKPRQYYRGDQSTPLSITEKFAEGRVQCIQCTLSEQAILFRMTDGAWELLPHQKQQYPDPHHQTTYIEYSLDDQWLYTLLLPLAEDTTDPEDYRLVLQTQIQNTLQTKKDLLLTQQHFLQTQLEAFELHRQDSLATASLGDFIQWLQTQADGLSTLQSFLQTLNMQTQAIDTLPLSSLESLLQHVNLGDDITLHVESVQQQPMQAQKTTSLNQG